MLVVEKAIERPLGATENLYWRFDARSPINFGVVVQLIGRLEAVELEEALLALQYRHPLLRVKILPDGKMQPWFRSGVGRIELREIEGSPAQAWSQLEQEVNRAFNSRIGPLMRVVLVRHGAEDQSLVMVFHHSVSDGKSSIYLTRDLLQSIKQQRNGQSARLAPLALLEYYGDRIPKLDPGEGTVAIRKAWRTLKGITQFLEEAGFPIGLQHPKIHKADKQADARPHRGVMIEMRELDSAITKTIAQRAKKEGTTMQCVLNAALSLTVATESPTGFLQRTACSQVLDMRERLDPPVGEECGLFASGASSLHILEKNTPFWPFARKIHQQLQHSVVTPLPFFHPVMHQQFIRLGNELKAHNYRLFSKIVGRLHPEGLAVSNLGRVCIEVENSPLKITRFGFGTNTTALNYLSTSAATWEGRMIWSFNGDVSLGRERLADLADKTVARMMRALQE